MTTGHTQVRRIARQRTVYTGLPSVYDIPKSGAQLNSARKGVGLKYDWNDLLTLGTHEDVPVPEHLTRDAWLQQVKRNAGFRALDATVASGSPDERLITYIVTEDHL